MTNFNEIFNPPATSAPHERVLASHEADQLKQGFIVSIAHEWSHDPVQGAERLAEAFAYIDSVTKGLGLPEVKA